MQLHMLLAAVASPFAFALQTPTTGKGTLLAAAHRASVALLSKKESKGSQKQRLLMRNGHQLLADATSTG
jgi:hypothetical protein